MPDPGIMQAGIEQPLADLLQLALLSSQKKVVLVMDLVESVRLMASDEPGTVRRWLEFTRQAQDRVIPANQGRLVKSLGDGLMVEFEHPRQAVAAAQTLHDLLDQANTTLPPSKHMRLRAGIHSSMVYSDAHDIYGAGVNLTSRLAALAQPGETVISASVRDELTDGLDTRVQDLGDCYVKHVEQPVRAYKISPVGAPPHPPREQGARMQPAIAVIPFEARSNEPQHYAVGELIADAVIAQLSRSDELSVISRLSSTVFRQRGAALSEVASHLGADYVLSGSYVASGGKLLVNAELAQAGGQQVIWAERMHGEVQDLLQAQSELSHQIADATHKAVLDTEVKKALTQPLPTLQSYSLMLSGVNLMHRSTQREFDMSRQVLESLIERHRFSATTRAWLAMWYVLRATRGLASNPLREAAEALDQTQRALENEPQNALALAVKGFVYCHLKKDLDLAWQRVNQALAVNPNTPMAWLYMSTIESLRGETSHAVACAGQAMQLSPMDPLRYYYLCLAGCAANFDGQWARASTLLQQSLRLNRYHAPTLRALVIAHSELGQDEAAKGHLADLLRIHPGLTVERYISDSPGGLVFRERFSRAMSRVGLPSR
jgi:class 3 adenylate cyclase/TolB-like protein/Tfp pilus assembly protein PilF